MNVAVLYNAAEDGEIGTDALLAGKELYRYSLKTFYLHPCIDYIVMMCRENGMAVHAEKYIESWKTEFGINKPVKIYQGSQNLQQILAGVEDVGRQDVAMYVLHDIRYPFVTPDMIYKVVEKAALYGAAVTTGEVKDDLVVCPGQKVLEGKEYWYVKYPAAIRAGHGLMDSLTELDGVLGKCVEYRPYLCNGDDRNLFVGAQMDMEMAEIILRMDKMGDVISM